MSPLRSNAGKILNSRGDAVSNYQKSHVSGRRSSVPSQAFSRTSKVNSKAMAAAEQAEYEMMEGEIAMN